MPICTGITLLIKKRQIGVIDFDDCAWGHYLLDVAFLLEGIRRCVASNQYDYRYQREDILHYIIKCVAYQPNWRVIFKPSE